MDKNEIIKKWMEKQFSKEELMNYKSVFSEDELNELIAITETSSHLEPENTLSKNEAWNKLNEKIATNIKKTEVIKLKRSNIFYIGIAASFLIIIGAAIYYLFAGNITVKTKFAENKQIELPDGSLVILNADSRLSYNENDWKKNRIVDLTGEAFFKVKKGEKFTVRCPDGEIKVKGTEFNIYNRMKILKVKCTEGKVAVIIKTGEEIILSKDQGIDCSENSLGQVYKVNSEHTKAWINGLFYFDKEQLVFVFNELERQYNIKVIYNPKETRFFSGYFVKNNLKDALEMICLPMNLTYHIEDSIVRIK